MADALVSIVVEKLGNVLEQEVALFASARQELEKLKETFQSIEAVLADAESKQVAEKSVQLWLSRLRKVAYDVQDVQDEWAVISNDGSDGDDDGNRAVAATCLPSPYACFDRTVSRCKIAHRIKDIREKLDQIDKDKVQFHFSQSGQSSNGNRRLVRTRTLTSSSIEEDMIGRAEDRETVLCKLVSESSSGDQDGSQVHVNSIVGIGGLGKTTLAREIYNDGRVQNHFDKVLWVCVSEPFDVINITKAILEDFEGNSPSLSQPNPLQNKLRGALQGKRFLLVLDDVWNEDEGRWKQLRASLSSGAPGSRILVTTRALKVANTMSAVYSHQLKGLSEDDSWRLFSSRAFSGRNEKECSEFEGIGRRIAGKCSGVPLSLKVMGGAMNTKSSMADWLNILDSDMWTLPQVTDKILPALLLSYYNLPPHLKQCFAYCSVYEKDAEMYKDELVKLWVVQGFVRLQGNRDVEHIGGEYFDELVARSMFQEVSENGSKCKMHDLLHDLAEFITKDETYVYTGEKPKRCASNVRHASLSVIENKPSINPTVSLQAKQLQTLFLFGVDKTDATLVLFRQARFLKALVFRGLEIKRLPETVWKLKQLRYLDLSRSWMVELPNDIGEMKHLKYLNLKFSKLVELPNAIGKLKQLRLLDLSGTKIVELPESVSQLRNLQTLKLDSCGRLKKLPRGMDRMVSLRHLEIAGTDKLDCLPEGLGRISCLQTLSKFIVGGEGGCKIDELQRLNSLQGCLKIQNLERVSSGEEARKAELWNKPHLRKLVLEMEEREEENAATESDAETERIDSAQEEREEENATTESDADTERKDSVLEEREEENATTERDAEAERIDSVQEEREEEKETTESDADTERKDSVLEETEEENVITERDAETERIGGVLEYLQPHVNLEKLKLDCKRRSSKLPSWMGNSSLSKLTKLKIGGFVQCEILPGLGKLVALRYLSIRDVRFKKVCNELSYGNSGDDVVGRRSEAAFPKLERLDLQDVELEDWELTMEAFLQHWNRSNVDGLPQHLAIFPLLTKLRIVRCHGIKGMGCSSSFPLLEEFTLEDSSEIFSSGLPHLPNLKKFYIIRIGNETLPDGGWELLAALQHLEIENCNEVKYLPDGLTQLQSLENLKIEGCQKLESLPEGLGQLKKLQSLRIYRLEVMTCLLDSLGQLESLEKLKIEGCNKLQWLPEGLGQLKTLRYLKIRGAEALTSLPDSLGQLVSLEDLEMDGLKKLQSLPEGMGQLKKLKSLTIRGAELLTCLPNSLGRLQSLEQLFMDGLKKLQVLPEDLGQLKKLKSLEISGDLEALTCLPDFVAQLESLEYLEISGWKKLESVPDSLLGGLKKLETLVIENMEALTCLPDSLEQLESLKGLFLRKCKKLKSLPRRLGGLKDLTMVDVPALTHPPPPHTLAKLKSSLVQLDIGGWKELESLPHWVRQLKRLKWLYIVDCKALRSLPHWLQDLPLLRHLDIIGCHPVLLERCKRPEFGGGRGGGEDWPKISRIPYVSINGEWM